MTLPSCMRGVSHDSWGMSHDSLGVSHDPLGVSHDSLGVSHDSWGMSHDSLGVLHDSLGVSHDSLGVSHDSWGMSHDSLEVSRDSHRRAPERQAVTEGRNVPGLTSQPYLRREGASAGRDGERWEEEDLPCSPHCPRHHHQRRVEHVMPLPHDPAMTSFQLCRCLWGTTSAAVTVVGGHAPQSGLGTGLEGPVRKWMSQWLPSEACLCLEPEVRCVWKGEEEG